MNRSQPALCHTGHPGRAIRTLAALPLILLILTILALTAPRPAAAAGAVTNNPVLLGGNVAGSWHMFNSDKLFYRQEAWYQAVQDLGMKFIDVNFLIEHVFAGNPFNTPETPQSALAKLLVLDQGMASHGLQYTISGELANWISTFEMTPRVNFLDHPDGSHRFDLPQDWVDHLLPPTRPGAPAFIGYNADEGEHNQLMGTAFVIDAPGTYDKPYYSVVDGMTLTAAYDKISEQCRHLREDIYQGRVRMISEQYTPDIFHLFARNGWTVCAKPTMDNLSSITMSVALGAALQYADRGDDFWVCADLWKVGLYPGWSPEGLRSGLLMGYWLGASALYIENIDYAGAAQRHPLASPAGSLVHWLDPTHYELTNHGRVAQDFYKNYVPAHPRTVRWQNYRPRVAFVRLPDGDWGQGTAPGFRDRLLGDTQHPSDAISHEWLHVWPILTHGVAKDGGILLSNKAYVNAKDQDFFVPIDSVAVFDHTVTGPVLDSVQCFIVSGHAITQPTFDAIKARVAQGATCIIARRLYDSLATGPLPGDWLIVDSFTDPAIAQKLQPFLGPPDVARFRFSDQTVEFRHGAVADQVTVTTASNAADASWLTLP